jgi:regulation of enolase protein 1 (concanavalin A-like superfamily)
LLGESAVAPYNFRWTNVPAGTFSLSARLVYDSGSTLSSIPASVTVTNPPPIVALTAPLNGSSYTAPATINLAASVTANGHTVTKVQFYNGASFLGESAVAPYSFRWTNVPAGSFSLSARLLYDTSGTVTSALAGITVMGLPAPWQTADIGALGVAGSAGCNISTRIFTVSGSGANIANTTDAFRFVQQTASGDCEIRAKVTAVQNTDGWAKAGVMIRETLNANSQFACISITANNGALFQYRTSTGGSAGAVQIPGPATPYWVRVVRTGTTFTGYISSDGITWAQVGSAQTISMASNVSIGLCVTAHNNTVLCTSTFSNVTALP